ncbi:hypothetical protein KIPB_002058 [Kipferlia bialata]|uniref:Kelch repeat type 1 n=1 Tax=Kipferlia bialata TaxID=797122 RepID=A0A391NJ72_9EUKA|nr:hypothetical protein KIPB_002058 [Kipferlia bialata]|eukprot:g2058.t1
MNGASSVRDIDEEFREALSLVDSDIQRAVERVVSLCGHCLAMEGHTGERERERDLDDVLAGIVHSWGGIPDFYHPSEPFATLLLSAETWRPTSTHIVTLDPVTRDVTFETVSNPIKTMTAMSLTRVGECAYVFGGSMDQSFHSQTDTLHEYDTATGEWRLIPKGEGEWPLARNGHKTFSLGGNLHIMAGVLCDMAYGQPSYEHWVYTPSTETWRLVTRL